MFSRKGKGAYPSILIARGRTAMFLCLIVVGLVGAFLFRSVTATTFPNAESVPLRFFGESCVVCRSAGTSDAAWPSIRSAFSR